jgi:hypothetical protein
MPERPSDRPEQTVSTKPSHRTRWLRFDEGGTTEGGQGAVRGSLLRTFGAWGRRAGSAWSARRPVPERRAEERHRVECLAWVGWKAWRRFPMRDALPINLSRGGALVFLDEPPPTDRPLWVFLETPEHKTIVKARAVGLQTTSKGQCAVRLAFESPCPYAFFETAVCGLAPADPRARLTRTPAQKMRAVAG